MNHATIMTKNNSGKVLTIFLIIAAVLLATLAAIAVFYFQLEIGRRERAEEILKQILTKEEASQNEIVDLKKQVYLLEDKNKDSDERINSLLEELELEKGLKDEMKQEAATLRDTLDKETKAKEKIKEQLIQEKAALETKVKDLQVKLDQEIVKAAAAVQKLAETPEHVEAPPIINEPLTQSSDKFTLPDSSSISPEPVDLEKIVVMPDDIPSGRILSVDKDAEFVIISIGSKDGLEDGRILSVYRGQEYLGDLKVTRVQDEMSAADFIPPCSSRLVRKNDQVAVK